MYCSFLLSLFLPIKYSKLKGHGLCALESFILALFQKLRKFMTQEILLGRPNFNIACLFLISRVRCDSYSFLWWVTVLWPNFPINHAVPPTQHTLTQSLSSRWNVHSQKYANKPIQLSLTFNGNNQPIEWVAFHLPQLPALDPELKPNRVANTYNLAVLKQQSRWKFQISTVVERS